jgi:hypothetical protein
VIVLYSLFLREKKHTAKYLFFKNENSRSKTRYHIVNAVEDRHQNVAVNAHIVVLLAVTAPALCHTAGAYELVQTNFLFFVKNLISFYFHLSGYTTGTIPNIATRITKAQLQKGDVMLYPADHVAFFGGWCDESQTTFFAIQEPGCHTEGPHYAFAQCIQYPFNWNPQDFSPYRYHGIRD